MRLLKTELNKYKMKVNLEQLEEMQKELFKQQCDLDIQKAMLKHFIKKEKSKQLTLTDVGKGTELLPDFLYKDDYEIKIGYDGDTEVSKEWNEYLEKIR